MVDDDEDEINIFTEALQKAGIPANCAWAQSGLHLGKAFPLPDMIFLDVNMPCIDGFECLVDIKRSPTLVAVPVILYSTGMNTELRKRGLALGAVECIAKTYSINDLAETLKQLIVA